MVCVCDMVGHVCMCVCVNGGACVCVCKWCMCVCVHGGACVCVCAWWGMCVCVCVYMVGGACVWVWVGMSAGVGSEGIASPHWPGAGHWGEGAGPTGGEGVDKGTPAPPAGQAPALATQKARWRREPSPSPPACLPRKPQDP